MLRWEKRATKMTGEWGDKPLTEAKGVVLFNVAK